MPVPAATVQDLYDALRAVTDHTRPAFDPEILTCLNYGYQSVVRAVSSVRSQFLESFVEPMTIPASPQPMVAVDVDLSFIEPPLWRPTRMILTNGSSGVRAIRFRYSSQVSLDTIGRELSNVGTFSLMYYDLLTGRLPGKSDSISNFSPLTVGTPTLFPIGQRVQIDPPPTVGTLPAYYGVVTAVSPLTLAPAFPPNFTTGTPRTIRQIRSRIMRIANPGTQTYQGRLYYTYRPPRFTKLDDLLDPVVSEHSDIIVYYGISMYLRSVNDSEASSWFQNAQLLRSELMQDLEPLSNENSEHLDSDLWGLD
jgi:hypothetical protein